VFLPLSGQYLKNIKIWHGRRDQAGWHPTTQALVEVNDKYLLQFKGSVVPEVMCGEHLMVAHMTGDISAFLLLCRIKNQYPFFSSSKSRSSRK